MATFFTNNLQDLDSLFLPRVSAKRADVGFKVEVSPGVFEDVSNRYEPIQEDSRPDVDFENQSTDLSKLFCSIDYRQVAYEYYTVPETIDKYAYGLNNNGQVHVRIVQGNLNSPGSTHSYTITLYNKSSYTVIASSTISFTGNTSNWVSFIGQKTGGYQIDTGIHTLTVKDNASGGLTDIRRAISVGYEYAPVSPSSTRTIVFTK